MDQPVRIEGVAHLHVVEMEVEPLLRRLAGHARVHGARLLHRHAVLLRQQLVLRLVTRARGRGVELEAPPHHVHVVRVLELPERGFEAALPDVAPGAGDVRPDLDFHAAWLDVRG